MLSLAEAKKLVLEKVSLLPAEEVSLVESVGRISAQTLYSDVDISPFDHAAMDGFALNYTDIEKATSDNPITLRVIDEVPAGSVFEGKLEPGETVRIMTGAQTPQGATAVVKYEDVLYPDGGNGRKGELVSFVAPAKPNANIRQKGEEVCAGGVVVEQGERIGAAGAGFMASCGITKVSVYNRPKVGIISIGSELVSPSEPLEPGCIRDGNSYALAACVNLAGGIPEFLGIVADNKAELASLISEASNTFDFIITSGGASDGDFDFIKPVVEELGTLYMTQVSMRPGKAQTFGLVKGVPVFGLPGNPAAAYCGFELIIRPALKKMQGFCNLERPVVTAQLEGDRKKKHSRKLFLRASLHKDKTGALWVKPATNQSSGLFSTLQRGNCLAVIPSDVHELSHGDTVTCILLDVEEGVLLP